MIERITNKEITSTFLESELRDILRHRDNMKIDKFDRMIKKAELLELEESINITDLINILIKHISSLGYKNIQINQTDIEDSAITGFVAVPHLVVEGDKPFSIIIIRCKKGIHFSKKNNKVKAVFVLVGTRKDKTIHLQSLTAIAQIIYNQKFENLWLRAKDKNNIKDILLLSKRRRLI